MTVQWKRTELSVTPTGLKAATQLTQLVLPSSSSDTGEGPPKATPEREAAHPSYMMYEQVTCHFPSHSEQEASSVGLMSLKNHLTFTLTLNGLAGASEIVVRWVHLAIHRWTACLWVHMDSSVYEPLRSLTRLVFHVTFSLKAGRVERPPGEWRWPAAAVKLK